MSQQHWDEHTSAGQRNQFEALRQLDGSLAETATGDKTPADLDDALGGTAGSYGTGFGDPLDGDEPHTQTFSELLNTFENEKLRVFIWTTLGEIQVHRPIENKTRLAVEPKGMSPGGVHCTARRKRVPIFIRELSTDFELPKSDF